MLTTTTLHGIFGGLPLPWQADGALNETLFGDTVRRLAKYKPQGIYNGGSTGEFFAQDRDTFQRATEILIDSCAGTGVATQVGIGALTTEEVVRRGRFGIKSGVGALQVAFPFWYEVTDEEAIGFYRDLHHAFEGFPLVHYDTGRCKRKLTPELLGRILEAAPSLIGVKYTGPNYKLLGTFTRRFPSVRFFANVEWFATLYRDMGITGSYDVMVYMNPPLVLRMYDLCRKGRFDEATHIQFTFQRFYRLVEEVGLLQYSDSAIDRAIGMSTGFLRGYTAEVKAPYCSPPPESVEMLKRRVEKDLPELLSF